ncbi:hypothetical protein [Paenibacillus sonchi]|uniref:hypothetical protein n=1 Tax=Paenibacillus sonchi TaxID=373687 RepID=UPI001E44CA0D|nr:hypothetical protein [Paenibacillus sonchi]MCE3204109.1 hypothetical protein [Paenibacillus sonchi]
MDNTKHSNLLISAIKTLTSNLFVSNFDSALSLAYEDPQYGLKRVEKSREFSEEYENHKLILSADRDIFHPEYKDQKHSRELTPEKVMEHSMFKAACSLIGEQKWENCSGRVENYNSLNGAINSLFKVLNNLSFKRDKGDRKIRSSTYDIEHIIYAVISDYFVSDDGNLRERTALIYKALDIKTLVLSPAQLVSKLNQLDALE